jgi:hypothetical protein
MGDTRRCRIARGSVVQPHIEVLESRQWHIRPLHQRQEQGGWAHAAFQFWPAGAGDGMRRTQPPGFSCMCQCGRVGDPAAVGGNAKCPKLPTQ